MNLRSTLRTPVLMLLALCSAACDSYDEPAAQGSDASGSLYGYLLMTMSPEGRTSYVQVKDALDFSDIEADAHEFAGIANAAAVDGKLLVSSGEEPSITQYAFEADNTWVEGKSVSFGEYPLDDNANFYYQFMLDKHTAYLPFSGYMRAVWDPTEMEILEVKDDTQLEPEKDGLLLRTGANPTAITYDKGPVLQPFYYSDDDELEWAGESFIAAYDRETHEEQSLIRIPCPSMQVATRDEDGNTYFSSRHYLPGLALFNAGPKPCSVRIDPDGELDSDWTNDLRDLTGGHYGQNFRYIGGGKALANVLHEDELGADFSGAVDAELVVNLWQNGPHWHLYLLDLEKKTGKPVAGLGSDQGSEVTSFVLDGRTLLLVPINDWTATEIYELNDDGVATQIAETPVNVLKVFKIR